MQHVHSYRPTGEISDPPVDTVTLPSHLRHLRRKVLHLSNGDMVMLDLASKGNYVAVRPSGTEPKVKFYMFAYEPAEQIANLEDTTAECRERLKQIERDLAAFTKAS